MQKESSSSSFSSHCSLLTLLGFSFLFCLFSLFCLYCCYIIYCMLPLEVNKVVQRIAQKLPQKLTFHCCLNLHLLMARLHIVWGQARWRLSSSVGVCNTSLRAAHMQRNSPGGRTRRRASSVTSR